MTKFKMLRAPGAVLAAGLVLFAIAWFQVWNSPLEGVHTIRQADTLFAGWSYCVEGSEFLRPRVAHRGATGGISIGEFPLASAFFALPCELTGIWSEAAVRSLVLLLLILNAFLWGQFVRRRWPERWPGWDWFLVVWLFSTHHLMHFTIALPDPLAFALIALAGLGFLAARDFRGPYLGGILCRLGAAVLFVIAFGMRPYLVPLLLLVIPGLAWQVGVFIACGLFYLVWFKWWILQSEVVYYATEATSFAETWEKLGPICLAFLEAVFRNALNFVGAWWVFVAFRENRDRRMAWLTAGAFLLVLGLRAPMILNHKYYLGAGVLLLTIWMVWGVRRAPAWLAWVYLLVAVVNVQHLWHGNGLAKMRLVQAEIARAAVAPEDKIAVYIGDGLPVAYLYWAKRSGWGFHGDDFRGVEHCPEGARWAMTWEDSGPRVQECRR